MPKLQADFANAKLRVAETLLPLGMQMLQLSDSGYLRAENVLSSYPAGKKPEDDDPPLLLSWLPEVKQWLLYGLLMYPDDLAEPGATRPGQMPPSALMRIFAVCDP